MTLGEKIRRYRELNDLTQKELGEKALEKKGDSALRIYKYENNIMAPKADYRQKIAEALDVDIEALSNIEISSDVDIMYVLFLLQEDRGMRIQREEGKIHLVFDETTNNSKLITYLNFWKNEDSKYSGDEYEDYKAYQKWKGRFSSNVKKYLSEKETAIDSFYEKEVKNILDNRKEMLDADKFSFLLKEIIDSGLSVTTKISTENGAYLYGFSFNVLELLNPPSEEAKKLFAKALAEIKRINTLGKEEVSSEILIADSIIITYYHNNSYFRLVFDIISDYLKAINASETEYDINRANELFENARKKYFENKSVDEIIEE